MCRTHQISLGYLHQTPIPDDMNRQECIPESG